MNWFFIRDFLYTYRMSKSRSWCFTINNYSEQFALHMFENIRNGKVEGIKYIIVGKEVGESGTPHLQGFVMFENPRGLKGIKREKYFDRAHLEIAKGTPKQASEYCKKDNDFVEYGEVPKGQGTRTDLEGAYKAIKEGMSVDDLAWENPNVYGFAHKALGKLEDIRLRKNLRTEMTQGEWIYGATGVGKSEYAFANPCYVYPYDNGWWDGYAQQDIVVIDEFRGQLPFNELLRMVDKHPNYFVRRRCREPMPFVSKKVIITSSMPPWEVFKKLDESDSLHQLYRRFKIYKIDKNGVTLVDPEDELDVSEVCS